MGMVALKACFFTVWRLLCGSSSKYLSMCRNILVCANPKKNHMSGHDCVAGGPLCEHLCEATVQGTPLPMTNCQQAVDYLLCLPKCKNSTCLCGPGLVSSAGDAGCSESGLEDPECWLIHRSHKGCCLLGIAGRWP